MKRRAMRSAAQASAALRFPAHSIAGRVGTSFKHEHLQAILVDGKRDRFFEVHAENYMGADGPSHAALSRLITGESLGAATSAAFSERPSFDLPANTCGLLKAGAFTTVLCGES
jgi:Protein of unknown function (DUF692)